MTDSAYAARCRDAVSLFDPRPFVSHSGLRLPWKIDCDALSDEDLSALARLVARRIRFGAVIGIPRGGIALRPAIESIPHCRRGGIDR